MSKYDKFDKEYLKVPVQFGHLSARERRCRSLGHIGSLMCEPFWIENYYRIDDGELSAGRFFYERRWKGEKDGTIKSDGRTWSYFQYTTYARLPDEIKKEIEKKEELKNDASY